MGWLSDVVYHSSATAIGVDVGGSVRQAGPIAGLEDGRRWFRRKVRRRGRRAGQSLAPTRLSMHCIRDARVLGAGHGRTNGTVRAMNHQIVAAAGYRVRWKEKTDGERHKRPANQSSPDVSDAASHAAVVWKTRKYGISQAVTVTDDCNAALIRCQGNPLGTAIRLEKRKAVRRRPFETSQGSYLRAELSRT
jgi:hypothetical protein